MARESLPWLRRVAHAPTSICSRERSFWRQDDVAKDGTRVAVAHDVLLSVQSFDVEEIGIHRRSWAIDAPGLWVRLVRQVGMGSDEELVRLLGFGRPADSRNLVGVGLSGRCYVRAGGKPARVFEAGEFVALPGRAACSSRGDHEHSFSLTVETDRNVWSARPWSLSSGRIGDIAVFRAIAESLCVAIESAWLDPSARPLVDTALTDLFTCLRSEGLPIPAIETRSFAPPPASIAKLARGVDRALSQTRSRAMLIDVENEGGACARTLQRAMPALCTLWGQTIESFRDHTRRTLLARACWAMTNPSATTELIAQAVGFSTPNAFCRAMASYGLPSPGRVRDRFRQLE